jgi:hypothetical protein
MLNRLFIKDTWYKKHYAKYCSSPDGMNFTLYIHYIWWPWPTKFNEGCAYSSMTAAGNALKSGDIV